MNKYSFFSFNLIFLIFFSFVFCQSSYAQTTSAITINPILKDLYIIVNTPIDEKNYLVIDYAIEILQKDLSSIDCYFALSGLKNINIDDKKTVEKFKELKDKYFDSIDDLEKNFAEKVVLISLWGGGIETDNDEAMAAAVNRIVDILAKNLESCKDKKKAAIINLMLTHDKKNTLFYVDKFLKDFGNHPAAPFIYLWKYEAQKEDSSDYINNVNEWIKKYGELYTPFGWKYKIDGYFDLVNHYIEIKEYNTAKDITKKIIKEAPGYLLGDQALTYEGFITGSVEIEINAGLGL